MLAEGSHGPSEMFAFLTLKGNGPKIGEKYGPTFISPIGGKDLFTGPSCGKG